MKKGLLIFGGIVLGLTLILAIGGMFLPSHYRVERSIVIDATIADVYPPLNRLKDWPSWTAWTKEKDPTMTLSYEGPEEGTGAVYKWQAEKMGNGRLEITQSDPTHGVFYSLKFEDFNASQGGLELTSLGENATKVLWFDEGNLGGNPINRYFGLMMDSWVGKDFEEGLGNLKRLVESNKI